MSGVDRTLGFTEGRTIIGIDIGPAFRVWDLN